MVQKLLLPALHLNIQLTKSPDDIYIRYQHKFKPINECTQATVPSWCCLALHITLYAFAYPMQDRQLTCTQSLHWRGHLH